MESINKFEHIKPYSDSQKVSLGTDPQTEASPLTTTPTGIGSIISIDPEKRLGERMGNYRLIRWLGRGAFADVYLGEHIYLKTQSAIKILYVHLSEKAQKAFLNEACTIARLDHPNIVRILDYGVESGNPFLVMAYAPNGSLLQRFPEGTRLSLEQVVPLVQQMASALDYAHEQGLIHRDVKPENMLIGAQNQVLLSDFGLVLVAQSMASLTASAIAGTVLYMAPEMLEGKAHFASDQYTLGVVTYQWLCGQCPFTGSSIQVGTQHMLAPPPSLCQRVPGLPPSVEQVVFRALAKDRAQRYENVTAFANALQEASKDDASIDDDIAILKPSSLSSEELLEPHEMPISLEPILSTKPLRRPSKIWLTALVLLVVTAVLAANVCFWYTITSSRGSTRSTAPTTIKSSPVIQPTVRQRVHIVGSSALLPLATKAAALFQQQNPGVKMNVQGGGSGVGLSAVNNNQADIGDSDIYADPTLYPNPNLTDHIVCITLMTMIVNPDVKITSLNSQQIINIYTGVTTNWRDVGGPNLPIVPLVKPTTSGTRALFDKYVLKTTAEVGQPVADASTVVVDTVAHTPGAIGYTSVSTLNSTVEAIALDGVSPTAQNIQAGKYRFWGFEHMYTLDNGIDATTAFLNFMQTPQIQQLAISLGYVSASTVSGGQEG